MSIPIRRASSVSSSDPVELIERALSNPLSQEKIDKAETIFHRAVKEGTLSKYGELGCSYETYFRSIPHEQAKETIERAKEAFRASQKSK